MIFKNISKTKLSLALISLVITFFVWQQGLRDSLNRPSVSFDISQKEQEIVELAVQSIPTNLKKFFITNDPVDEINNALSKVEFNGLTERNKLIRIILSSESNLSRIDKNLSLDFKNENYKLLSNEIEKKSNNDSYKIDFDKFILFKDDRFLYHILSKKFHFDDSSLITKSFSSKMFLKNISNQINTTFNNFDGLNFGFKNTMEIYFFEKVWLERNQTFRLRINRYGFINCRWICCLGRGNFTSIFNNFS